jgi:hypothetical protein
MVSLRWRVSGVFSLFLSLAAMGCGSSSTGGGAGGSLGSGGGGAKDAASDHGGAGSGGITGVGAGGAIAGGTGGVGAGGAGGSGVGAGGAANDARDVAVSQLDAAVDSPVQPVDVGLPVSDSAMDAPAVTAIDGGATLAQIKSLIAARCAGCHTGAGTAATRINFTDSPDAGITLYDRLLGPLVLETYCGENIDAGGDAAAARRAIVPGDPASSFLYLKITGTQPSPGNPPANCGVRMPRVFVPGVDGGAPTQPSCEALDGGAAANCLGAADIDLVRQWILEGAPQ